MTDDIIDRLTERVDHLESMVDVLATGLARQLDQLGAGIHELLDAYADDEDADED